MFKKHGVWPGYIYIYYNIIVLMGKPAGGSRPVALMPMLYRMWCRARRIYIDEWERNTAGDWDAAVKGLSALRASILSQMRDEMATARGEDTLTVLWDMESSMITYVSRSLFKKRAGSVIPCWSSDWAS